ncbi:hypothetical protein JNO12_12745 [Erwinia aphidicola]|nr:hypothetical protein [Erwinia aphidicola]
MDSRAQFEAYWDTQKSKFHKDRYEPFKNIEWEAWQESRAVIEVELPDYTDESDSELSCFDGEYEWGNRAGANYAVEQCAKRLRNAGISIKGESS